MKTIIESPSVLSIIIISIVSAVGLQLGKLKLLNISLGITFVFFVGIVILGEPATAMRMLAAVLIVSGLVLLKLSSS